MSDTDRKSIDEAWVMAAANAIEYEQAPYRALVAGGPEESIALCLFAAIIPTTAQDHYMAAMGAMHDNLIAQYPPIFSTRPDETH